MIEWIEWIICDDCGESFPRNEMHHDDSGSYCEADYAEYIDQQAALYAPRGYSTGHSSPATGPSEAEPSEADAYERDDPKHPDWLDRVLD
jgi:hypothetical protein